MEKTETKVIKPPTSKRVGVASDMAKEIHRLETVVQERNIEIERLCALLEAKDA